MFPVLCLSDSGRYVNLPQRKTSGDRSMLPIVRYVLEMAVRHAGRFEAAPRLLPSGWAALLELHGLR